MISSSNLIVNDSGSGGNTFWNPFRTERIDPTVHPVQSDVIPDGYIEVATAQDLYNVRNDLTANYFQTADIDLSGYANWTPIGPAAFVGIYDGNSHKISNMTITSPDPSGDTGLFAWVDSPGKLQNIILEDFSISFDSASRTNVGGIAGTSLVTIENCIVTGTINTPQTRVVGGIVGSCTADITNCTAYVDITGYVAIGGIVGYIGTSSGLTFTISHCTFEGDINASNDVGGIVGYLIPGGYSFPCYIEYCTSDVTIKLISDNAFYIGGIAGRTYSGTHIRHCKANIVISCEDDTLDDAGGILGYGDATTLTDCHARGNIILPYASSSRYSWSRSIGGVVGQAYSRSDETCPITKCSFIGNIMLDSREDPSGGYFREIIGGVAGAHYANNVNSLIQDCYCLGNIVGMKKTGGIVGEGGSTKIDRCYFSGTILCTPEYHVSIAPIIGDWITSCTVTWTYYNSDIVGVAGNGRGTPKTAAELRIQSTFGTWSFSYNYIWGMSSSINTGFPFLVGEFMFDQIEVWDVDDLLAIDDMPYAKYIQMADINLSDHGNWTPLCSSYPFLGEYDGNGFTISNLTSICDHPDTSPVVDHAGLFAEAYGTTFKNITLEDVTLVGIERAGAIIAYMDENNVTSKRGTILNCRVKNVTIYSASRYYYPLTSGYCDYGFAGIVGAGYTTDITGCIAFNVTVLTYDGSIAGIVGDAYDTNVVECYSQGKYEGALDIGGIVGYGNGEYILRCYADVDILGVYRYGLGSYTYRQPYYMGGLCGEWQTSGDENSIIENCHVIGTIDLDYDSSVAGVSEAMCGMVGWVDETDFITCYTNVALLQNTNTTGILGCHPIAPNDESYPFVYVRFANCYYNKDTGYNMKWTGTPYPDIPGVYQGKTFYQLTLEGTFINYDFVATWGIHPYVLDGLPYLQWMYGVEDVPGTFNAEFDVPPWPTDLYPDYDWPTDSEWYFDYDGYIGAEQEYIPEYPVDWDPEDPTWNRDDPDWSPDPTKLVPDTYRLSALYLASGIRETIDPISYATLVATFEFEDGTESYLQLPLRSDVFIEKRIYNGWEKVEGEIRIPWDKKLIHTTVKVINRSAVGRLLITNIKLITTIDDTVASLAREVT